MRGSSPNLLIRVPLIVFGGALALFVVWAGIGWFLTASAGCSGKERAIATQYTHYGGRRPLSYSWSIYCGVSYTADASMEDVFGYYDKLLRQKGWNVVGFRAEYYPKRGEGDPARRVPKLMSSKRLSDLSKVPRSASETSAILYARRDGYGYVVVYHTPGTLDRPFSSDEKPFVTVSVDDKKRWVIRPH